MMEIKSFKLDNMRSKRTGLDEAIYCPGKSVDQIGEILRSLVTDKSRALFTKIAETKMVGVKRYLSETVPEEKFQDFDYDPFSETLILRGKESIVTNKEPRIAVVAAGTSDLRVSKEVSRTLFYYGEESLEINDVGVAGLWRLLERLDEISKMQVVIAVAGMDAALPTVLGGLISSVIIGVPTSVGYGIAEGGQSALSSMLSSCASGLLVTNIDNGYGAGCAAVRIIRQGRKN